MEINHFLLDLQSPEKAGDEFRSRRRNYLENERPNSKRSQLRRHATEMRFNEYVGTKTDFSQLIDEENTRRSTIDLLFLRLNISISFRLRLECKRNARY